MTNKSPNADQTKNQEKPGHMRQNEQPKGTQTDQQSNQRKAPPTNNDDQNR